MPRTTLTGYALTLAAALTVPAGAQPIDLDGRLVEWPLGVHAIADGGAVYFRVDFNQTISLQSAPWQISLLIDVDGDASTGAGALRGGEGLGIDLEFRMSPFERERLGLQAFQHPGSAPAVLLPAGAHGFFWAPTHASRTFEFRMQGLPPHESVRARFVAIDLDGDVMWASEVFGIQRAPTATERPAVPALAKPEGALRVVSMNVRWASPFAHPDAFARIFRALDPDVLLVQEWDDAPNDAPPYTAEEIDAWFTAVEPAWEGWNVIKGSERGVAIATRFPAKRIDTDAIRPIRGEHSQVDDSRGIRVAAARIATPNGDMLAASVHLKCCGAYGGPEDGQRAAEARAVNQLIRDAHKARPAAMIVIGGDFNLVGDPAPLALLADGADVDGSTLESADTVNLGTRRRITWQGGDDRFPPGRLDYVLYSGAGAPMMQAFTVDPALLAEQELLAIGLEPGDLSISDHLPIVVDLRPKVKESTSR